MTKKSTAKGIVLISSIALALVSITLGESIPDVPLVDHPESLRNGQPITKVCGQIYPRCQDQMDRERPARCLFYSPFDSGFIDNPSDEEKIVFEHTLDHPFVRKFGVNILPKVNRLNLPPGSVIEVTTESGASVRYDSKRLSKRWFRKGQGWWDVAYGNAGESVTIRLIAGPRTTGNRVASAWTATSGRNVQEDSYDCTFQKIREDYYRQFKYPKGEERGDQLPTLVFRFS